MNSNEAEPANFGDEEFDFALRAALSDLPVPKGMAERLKLRLHDMPHEELYAEFDTSGESEAGTETTAGEAGVPERDPMISSDEPAEVQSGVLRSNWFVWGGIACATVAALLLVSVLGWRQSLDRNGLAMHCVNQLALVAGEQSDTSTAQWKETPVPSSVLNHLLPQFKSPVQGRTFQAKPFGQAGQMWKLDFAQAPLYVFEFADSVEMDGLTSQLVRVNQQSDVDGWQLIAFRTNSKIVVLASKQNVWEFIKFPEFV